MDFLVKDLIKPNNYPQLNKIIFHKDVTRILKNDNILFDTLFYGVSGAGKTTILMAYLQKLFGQEVLTLNPNNNSASDMNNIITTIEKSGVPLTNNNLIVINDSISDDTFYEFLLSQFDILGEKINYMLVLHLERFKQRTISLLMNFIENRKSLTYVLATSNHFNKLDKRVISRFECYRIPRPSREELTDYFHNLIPSKFEFEKSRIYKIIESTNCDMKLSIIYINQRLLEAIDPNLKKKSIDNFKYYITCLLQLVFKNDLKQLPIMRTMILTIYQSSLTWNEYLKKTLEILYTNKNITEEQKFKIIQLTSELDHKVSLSKPNYIHYEAFIFMIMNVLFG
jgi:GTPase SAR1 family protein